MQDFGQKFGQSQGAGRLEDVRFLTGAGRYVDDIAPKGALHAVFLRAPVAHARITALDTVEAEAMPGVAAILTAERLRAAGMETGMRGTVMPNRDGTKGAGPVRPVLAEGFVRHVGDPVAMVVAQTAAQALDAAEAIVFDYEDLPAKMDVAPGGTALHPEAPDNVAFDFALGAAGTPEKLATAAHRVRMEVGHNRIIVNAMEPRAAFAEMQDGRLHLCFNGQGVWIVKTELARMLKLPPEDIRVTNPDVGGGFGMKAMTYPEYFCVAQAARMLGRAVHWSSGRTEAMLSDNGGRDLVAQVDLGFDSDYKIIAYHVDVLCNLGAYNSQFGQAIQSHLFSRVLTGNYDIQDALLTVRGIYTNSTPVDAYRGAGRPEAILTIERAMDHAARELGRDPVDLRKRSLIRRFPYTMCNGDTIDVGDFAGILDHLEREADLAGYAARHAESAARGLVRGKGVASYIEAILGAPNENARVEFEGDGTVTLFVGTQSNGQGHETVFPRILSERTGIDVGLIRVVQGDSDRIAAGGGTGGSRSLTTQGTAIHGVSDRIEADLAAFLATDLGEGVTFDNGRFGAPGSNLRLTMIEAVEAARKAGRADLTGFEATTTLPGRSYPNGAHLAEVELDPETGALRLDRYTVADDFGTMLAPALVEGQVHGGVAQGFGQVVTERAVFDEQGQLLTASFMDYAMPRAEDLPMIRFSTRPTPTTTNIMGVKGCGEAGTVGSLGAIANAVADALDQCGVGTVEMPFTPGRLWPLLDAARRGDAA